jgi:hypothetical protein
MRHNKRLTVWRAALIAAVVAMGSLLGASPAWASVQYEIVNSNSQYCLTVVGNGVSNGSPVVQGSCIGAVTQRWIWVWTAQSTSTRFNLYNPHSGRCLDSTNNHASNVGMYIWDCELPSANTNQNFWALASGSYFTVRMNWNQNQCLSITNNSYAVGARVNHVTCTNSYWQKWYRWSV